MSHDLNVMACLLRGKELIFCLIQQIHLNGISQAIWNSQKYPRILLILLMGDLL